MATVSKLFRAHVEIAAAMKKGDIPESPLDRLNFVMVGMRIRDLLLGCEVEIELSPEDEELIARLASCAEPPKPVEKPA